MSLVAAELLDPQAAADGDVDERRGRTGFDEHLARRRRARAARPRMPCGGRSRRPACRGRRARRGSRRLRRSRRESGSPRGTALARPATRSRDRRRRRPRARAADRCERAPPPPSPRTPVRRPDARARRASSRERAPARADRPTAGGTSKAPSTSAPMSATTRAVASQAAAAASVELNRPRWNEMRRLPFGVTSAFRRFASPALSGLSTRRRKSRSPSEVCSENTAWPVSTSMKISYPQRCAASSRAGAVRRPRARGERRRRRRPRAPGGRDGATRATRTRRAAGSAYQRAFALRSAGRSSSEIQVRSAAPMILELDEDGPLHHPAKRARSRRRERRARSTCCDRRRAR